MKVNRLLSAVALLFLISTSASAQKIAGLEECSAEQWNRVNSAIAFEPVDKSENHIANALTSIANTVEGAAYLAKMDDCFDPSTGYRYYSYDAAGRDVPHMTHLVIQGNCADEMDGEIYESSIQVIFTLDLEEAFSGKACYLQAG